jgi:predicted ATPase
VAAARETLLAWRFYHHFSTDSRSALRQPGIGFWSPVLDADGGNLAANLQTLIECRKAEPLHEAFQKAFPDCEWSPVDDSGRFQFRLLRPGLKRWLEASELSDGTLRFFCLCAALLSPKPPPLMILNEPEASLHPDLMAPLAELIARVSADTQLLIVSHSKELTAEIAKCCETKVVDLISYQGQTRERLAGSENSRRVWSFDEDE